MFAFSVATELLCIKILRGWLTAWLDHSHRQLLLVSMILVNLLNAATAMYFCSRAVRAEVSLKLRERRQERASVYLNHHLRNALSIVQNAAFLTNDEPTIKLGNETETRIQGRTEAGCDTVRVSSTVTQMPDVKSGDA